MHLQGNAINMPPRATEKVIRHKLCHAEPRVHTSVLATEWPGSCVFMRATFAPRHKVTSRDTLFWSRLSASALPSSLSKQSSAVPTPVAAAAAASLPLGSTPLTAVAVLDFFEPFGVALITPPRSSAAPLKRFIASFTRPRFARQAAGVITCVFDFWQPVDGKNNERGCEQGPRGVPDIDTRARQANIFAFQHDTIAACNPIVPLQAPLRCLAKLLPRKGCPARE